MTTVAGQEIKSIGPKLVPFFKSLTIYFVLFLPHDKPSIFAAIIKCLPTISLMLFVLLYGISFGIKHTYSRRILIGLLFGCIGDGLLIWPYYFELGILSFTVGHIFYITAFGFKPLNLKLGITLYIINIMATLYLYPGLYGILLPGVTIYTFILTTMTWRALSRVQNWTWNELCAGVGGSLFVLSDFILGIDHFRYNIEYGQAIIMITYYAAQLSIALSIVNSVKKTNKDDNYKNN